MPTTVPTPPPRLIVDTAIEAIRLYAGDVTREDAATLLTWWEHYQKLAPGQVRQILTAFAPARRDPS
jgi:hypothetical protein